MRRVSVPQLGTRGRKHPVGITRDRIAVPRCRSRQAKHREIPEADLFEQRALDGLQFRGSTRIHTHHVAHGNALHFGEGFPVPPIVRVVVGAAAESDRDLHSLHPYVAYAHIHYVPTSALVRFNPDPGRAIPDVHVLDRHVRYPARHFAADSDPRARRSGARDSPHNDVRARTCHSYPVLVPPTLHGHEIVPALDVTVFDANVGAGI